eukprot:gene4525-7903_t
MFEDEKEVFKEEDENEDFRFGLKALNLKYLCIALEIKFKNAFSAKKKVDFIALTIKDDISLPGKSRALAAFINKKLPLDNFEQFKDSLLENTNLLQNKISEAMFDYYDQTGDGLISKDELKRLFQNIQFENDGFWLKEGFLEIAFQRISANKKKISFEQFDNFYHSTLNSDTAEFQEEILFELENKKETSIERLDDLLKDLKVEKEKNILINISNAKKAIHSMDDFDLLKNPILKFFDEKPNNEEEEMEILNKLEEEEGKSLLVAFYNVAFNYYDKDQSGYLEREEILEFLNDRYKGSKNEEELDLKYRQILNLYYSDFIDDSLTYFHFYKLFLKVIKTIGNDKDLSDSDDEFGMSSDSDY